MCDKISPELKELLDKVFRSGEMSGDIIRKNFFDIDYFKIYITSEADYISIEALGLRWSFKEGEHRVNDILDAKINDKVESILTEALNSFNLVLRGEKVEKLDITEDMVIEEIYQKTLIRKNKKIYI